MTSSCSGGENLSTPKTQLAKEHMAADTLPHEAKENLLSQHIDRSRTPPGRMPSFGSEEQPSSTSSKKSEIGSGSNPPLAPSTTSATNQTRHPSVEISGPLKIATDGTVPPSDSSSSTNPYHSDEECEHQTNESRGSHMDTPTNIPASTDARATGEGIPNTGPLTNSLRDEPPALIRTTKPTSLNQSRELAEFLSSPESVKSPSRCVLSPNPSYLKKLPTLSSPRTPKRASQSLSPKRASQNQSPMRTSLNPSPKLASQSQNPCRGQALTIELVESEETLIEHVNSLNDSPKQAQQQGMDDNNDILNEPTTHHSSVDRRERHARSLSHRVVANKPPPVPSLRSQSSSRATRQMSSPLKFSGSRVPPSGKNNANQKKKGLFGRFSSFRKNRLEKETIGAVVSPDNDTGKLNRSINSDRTSVPLVSKNMAETDIVKTTGNYSVAEVSPESVEEAVRELDALQTELARLKSSATTNDSSNDLQHLRCELEAAKKAAATLEGINKKYRKAQKEMLHDLEESQIELNKLRENYASNTKPSVEGQRLAEELASTTSELLALQAQHQALLKAKQPQRIPCDQTHRNETVDEIRLNLQKDLAQAMATISKLEEENQTLRKRMLKMGEMEERAKRIEFERDEYLSQLNDQASRQKKGSFPSDPAAIVTKMQLEKQQLLARESILKEKINKLETKNENQKAIFQTAVEIKEVEMKITKKERDILATRLEEYKQERNIQDDWRSREVDALQARLKNAEEERKENDSRMANVTEKVESLKRELDAKKLQVVSFQKMLEESQRDAQADLEMATEDLSNQINKLKSEIASKEQKISDLEEQRKLESFKARRIMDEKVTQLQRQIDELEGNLSSREEKIRTLEEDLKVRSGELHEERRKALRRSSPTRSDNQSPLSTDGHNDRLAALRDRLGNYESVMRAKVAKIRKMDASPPSKQTSSPTPTQSQPTLVVATPVAPENPELDEKYVEMEKSLQKQENRINELEKELEQAKSLIEKTGEAEEAKLPLVENNGQKKEATVKEIEKDEAGPPCVEEMVKLLEESKGEIASLQKQLAETQQRLVDEQESSGAQNDDEVKMEKIVEQLAEKETMVEKLQNKIQTLDQEKADLIQKQKSTETELAEAKSQCESMHAQLANVSKLCKNKEDEQTSGSDDTKLRRLQNELADANAKIEMLEEFINEDSQTALKPCMAETIDGVEDESALLKKALQEKEQELEALRATAESNEEQLLRARSIVEGLELEKAHGIAKVKQLSSLLEKQGKDEVDMQLYKKCIELAEVSSEKDDLAQKLRLANSMIKRLEEELVGTQDGDTEERRKASLAEQHQIKLIESDLKIDELRAKLSEAEKESRILRDKNERLSNSGKSGIRGEDEVANKMKFLEEQNAAYAATLKALRIEIATRHEGTAFE